MQEIYIALAKKLFLDLRDNVQVMINLVGIDYLFCATESMRQQQTASIGRKSDADRDSREEREKGSLECVLEEYCGVEFLRSDLFDDLCDAAGSTFSAFVINQNVIQIICAQENVARPGLNHQGEFRIRKYASQLAQGRNRDYRITDPVCSSD